jgi:predicted NAD/FAD-binding protein
MDLSGQTEMYDHVILATHADDALRMLTDADAEEQSLLGEFKYQPNVALLHTDSSVMPKHRLAWAAWNYRMDRSSDGKILPSTVYWMNKLQSLGGPRDYFVSINGENSVNPKTVLKRIEYEHPLFSLAAIRAQQRLPNLNERMNGVLFCGSYFRYGFHEDAFTSALDLCRVLTGERLMP